MPENHLSLPEPPDELLSELKELAVSVAVGAAHVLVQYSASDLSDVRTKSSPTDLVSEADRASETYITSALRQARPDDSLLAEEGTRREGKSGIRWVADPLDGTTNFFFGVPAYSVSLAAQWHGKTVVGAVVDPSRQETWAAVIGRGAQCNGKPCRVASGRSTLATALVATGFSYRPERRAVQAAVLAELLPVVRDIRRFGSAAIDLCWVAAGRYDAYYESWLNDWDWAAGQLICQEAGGSVSMLSQRTLVASTPEIHDDLSAALAEGEKKAGLR
ncbi:MAG: inositol monophosphatase family protein [Acidimicrobiales bacterium]